MALPSRVALLGTLVLSACATHPPPPPNPPAPAPKPAVQVSAPEVHAGVAPVDATCGESTQETCNALDDDCDGAIDEGCGYESGGVQVTIAWDTGADIDLYVTDPSGESLFYNSKNRRSSAGGHLDFDSRGDCRAEQTIKRVENAYWPDPAPAGKYLVQLHYFGPCGDNAQTTVTLTVAVDHRVLGTYRYVLKPEEKVPAVSFEIQ